MKKLLSLALACIFVMAMAVMPMTGVAAETQVIDFNAPDSASYGGTVTPDAATKNPYLAVADGQTVDIPFAEGAATVDFKLKTVDKAKTVTVTLGTVVLTFSNDEVSFTEASTAKSASFVETLWYNLRLTAGESGAALYIDGVQMGTADSADSSFTGIRITGSACIDDIAAYADAQETNRGMVATVLDFGSFENLTLTTGSTATQRTGTAPSAFKKSDAHGTTTSTLKINCWANNISDDVCLETHNGVYGKAVEDKGLYIGHNAATAGVDSHIDFNVADTGFIKAAGDTQVLSFNLAFPEDASNRAMTIRGYGWQTWGDAPYSMGWVQKYGFGESITNSSKPTTGMGQVMKIYGDRMYLFGDTTFYSLVPALMPEQWNSFRLEMTKGQHVETDVELTYKAYVNDILIAEGNVPYNYVWRNSSNDQREFFGFGRISFNYDWRKDADTNIAGGYYLDDVNVTNYYGATVPQRPASPLLTDANFTDAASTSANPASQAGWNHDKWVTGNVVYVDSAMTLAAYLDQLAADKRVGDVIFRDATGAVVSDLNTPIGDITYMELVNNNYERRWVGLVGKVTTISDFDESAGDSVSTSATVGTWYNSGGYAALATTEAGGGCSGTVVSLTSNGTSSQPSLRYALSARYNNANYIYTSADRYRPVTFEFSALMPAAEDGYLRFCGRYLNGPSGAANNNLTSSFEKNFIILENGEIRAQQRPGVTGTTLLGTYTPGEWNHFAVTYYPGMQTNRVDIRVNGAFVKATGNITRSWSGALMLAGSTVKLQSMEEFVIYYYNAADNSQPVTSKVLLNNLKVSAGYYQAPEQPALSYEGKALSVSDKTVTMFSKPTAASLTEQLQGSANGTVAVYADNTCTAPATGYVASGNKIVVQKGNLLQYYNLTMPVLTIKQRETAEADSAQVPVTGTVVAPGREVIVTAPGVEKGQLFMAVYEDASCQKLVWGRTDYSASLGQPRVGMAASGSDPGVVLQEGQVIKIFYVAPDNVLQPVLPVTTLTVES
ncbi:MAG: hypothetical protein ACI4QW_00650 [Clostridia bacterium]